MLDELIMGSIMGMRPIWAGIAFAIAALLVWILFDGFSWIGFGFAVLLGLVVGTLMYITDFTIRALSRTGKGR